jgi:tetratricopeptide (TPR) repeat protein
MAAPITFVVPGVRADRGATRGAGGAALPIGRVKDSITVTAQRAAGESEVRTTAIPGEDVVLIEVAGGPELWLHPDTARELLQSQQDDPLLSRGGTTLAPGEVRIPARLQWRLEEGAAVPGATRGFLSDVLVRGIQVLTGFAEDKAADFAASKVVQAFDSKVKAGVYRLDRQRPGSLKDRTPSTIASGETPSLVLIHGTFSETSGTFGKLWNEHPELVDLLFKRFQDRVYALDHPTLGASPIANAITLAEAAPEGARLHLLTHSRGGLVAEVLARVCSEPVASVELFANDGSSAQELKKLAELVARKRISIDRVVRVACPARGTLLASKRLDAYVSVVKWALELAQIPVADELVEFLGEVARRRADPDMVPGLAAQIPDSPLVKWLHATDKPIKGDLRVVAGDLEGDSVRTWVKTLLSDAFFWTDNDLVVQTRSMYGGSPREKDSTFVLDQGGKVSHFNYFSNPRTANAIVNALALSADPPDEFRVIGPLSWSGESSTGVRAALQSRGAAAAAELPALFILPGILGSNLKIDNDRIWLGWRLVNGLKQLAYDPKGTNILPDGPIGIYYDDLATFFFDDHDVKPFAFDWRRPMAAEAKRLADEVAAALDARKTSKQPVRIIAHSMGGLVARMMQIVSRSTWDRMMAADGARLLMLGTPNGGSWAPMQVLSGDDTFGNLLTSVGAPFGGNGARTLIANFPGIMQLQAGLLNGLGTAKTWEDLAAADLDAARRHSPWHNLPLQLDQMKWGLPAQSVLDEAVELRRALDRQRDTDLASFAHKLLLVVGKADSTPAGYKKSDDGVVYLDAPDQGDGRVLLDSAVLPGVATWVVDADHGSLPRHKEAFGGYRDLLGMGRTDRLATLTAAQTARGQAEPTAKPLVRSRPSRLPGGETPPQREIDVLAPATTAPAPQAKSRAAGLHITVMNGDLTYVSEPLLIGHYRALRLTGTEAAMDGAIGGAMIASLQRGLYPDAPGSHQVFVNVTANADNPWQLPRPEAVIVAGLGAEGELRGSHLVNTVRQAVIGWAQRLTERRPVPPEFTLATTLLGSGGSGITAGQAAQLIAQGVREANEQLARDGTAPPRWPRVSQLKIIELFLDRASEAWNALRALAAADSARFTVEPTIAEGIGAMRRPTDAGYRGADYDFISAIIQKTENEPESIVYTVNSKRARSDVRPQSMQVGLVRNLVLTASNNANTDAQIGRTLFRLLVPLDLEPFLGSSTETVLELDTSTAAIPWEALEPTKSDGKSSRLPWSIRTKLLRKLRTLPPPTRAVTDASADDDILVIGDPACDRLVYPLLMGARREATKVADCLTELVNPRHVHRVISGPKPGDEEPDLGTVINALIDGDWRIIHIAGHGEPPTDGVTRGVVLSDGAFFGPREIKALRVIPELVFVNCCHLAADAPKTLFEPVNYNRAEFASGVAHALIEGGVRCVIAAGWAVDDEAASVFATSFYKALLGGDRFIDAVATARESARSSRNNNTWAAYQCYGDPDWRFRTQTGDAQKPTSRPAGQEFSGIASAPALIVALERIAVETEYQGKKPEDQAVRLHYLEQKFAQYWEGRGNVAEAFGTAWLKAKRFDEAIKWYQRAREAQDGTASFVSIEQLANAKIRLAWERAERDGKTIDQARKEIEDAMTLLDRLIALAPTVERESLYGSGYKRLALLEAAAAAAAAKADDQTATAAAEAAEAAAIGQMLTHYEAAETIARKSPSASTQAFFYPAMNRIAAQLASNAGTQAMDNETITLVRSSMGAVAPNFWSVVGQTELDMYVVIAANSLAEKAGPLIEKFREHHTRVDNTRLWGSVFDNATFVLSKYQARASQSEAAAAKQLLDALGSLAGRAAASTGSGATKGTPKAAPAGNTKAAKKARKTKLKAKPAGGARTQQASTPKRKR